MQQLVNDYQMQTFHLAPSKAMLDSQEKRSWQGVSD
jgi:hypothetical protein